MIDLSLGRIEGLLARLGNPQDALPPVVHVAGTNGKGSVIAFMRAALEAAGYRVHVYTSPHLVQFNERIRLAGSLISDEALTALLEECERINGKDSITFFEVVTAAAFLAFVRTPADVLLLETGLGGRLDATNVVKRPALTVLTPIAMDHQHYLGPTLDHIAAEKAGIMKQGVACLSASQERRVTRLLKAAAGKHGAPLFIEGADWFMRKGDGGVVFQDKNHSRRLPAPGLLGAHQVRNAGLAVAALDRLDGVTVPDAALALGLKTVEWPARLQRLTAGPLAELLPEGWELWLDGGHNPSAAKALASQARHWRDRPLHLVFGMLGTKDASGFLKALTGRVADIRTVAIPGEINAVSATDLAALAHTWSLPAEASATVADAVKAIAEATPTPGRILICGSLYLAGSVLGMSSATGNGTP